MRAPKALFIDLDGTLIETRSKKGMPQGLWDMEIKVPVMYAIKKIEPEYVYVVTNQGGIGRFYTEEEFEKKLDYVVASLRQYIRHERLKEVEAIYCSDRESDYWKPGTGMLKYVTKFMEGIYKEDMLMVGDASGGEGKSDTDLKTAVNFGIKYLDVDSFIKTYFEK